MTRVLMVVSNGFTHDPRVAAEVKSLTGAGYRLIVLAWDRKGTLPLSEVHDRYTVVRLRNTLGMKLRRYDFFRLRPFWRLALRRALSLQRAGPFDIVHCHDLDTLPVGIRYRKRTGARLVYDAHEIFPYLLELSRARRWAPRFEALERELVPDVDAILVAGPAHRDYLAPMARAPITLVSNSKPLAYDAYAPPTRERFTIVYYGGLDPSRLLLPLCELALEDPTFDVEIAGSGPLEPPIRSLAARSPGNLRFLGMLPMDRVIPATHEAHAVFSMFDPYLRLNRIGAPNKFFEALVTGRPVLVSRGTWVAGEVEAADCGLAVEYTKAALHEAIRTLRDDPEGAEQMGRNALRLARERYNWGLEEEKLLDAYKGLRRG